MTLSPSFPFLNSAGAVRAGTLALATTVRSTTSARISRKLRDIIAVDKVRPGGGVQTNVDLH